MKSIFAIAAFLAGTVYASANPVLNFDVNSGNSGANNDQTVGWMFNVDSVITVTHLSWYDHDQDGIDEHEVGIWAPDASLVASVVIPSGTAATLDGIWRIVDIPDVVLQVGAGYVVGGYNGASSTDVLKANTSQTVAPQITFVDAMYSETGLGFVRPDQFSIATSGFYGPSFNYQVGAVPEPATMLALAAGGAALLRRRNRK